MTDATEHIKYLILVPYFYRWSFGVFLYEIFTIGKPIPKVIGKLRPRASTSLVVLKIERTILRRDDWFWNLQYVATNVNQ